ncbi:MULTISPECIES: serine O-acetyltransferase EpsC [Lachnospiraceae]|uniref:Serine acetyltransferase n=1 Tax=Faecalicatena acetigenes TaxID=2981790 RepID=A0ABT2TDF4_9FIRM|nr:MULTISPECIES: serine O-acetyltransferase EpsC [Lachnospiraceae]MCU6748282.1 serine O-acetyltransferase [Faecalicatena acetigenes]RGT71484.1 serine O-acetyltransferase [Ruminococcus sp. AF18-22]SCI35806.1 Serine acetyltransferase [uncultured Clostridium sp.]
MGIISYIREEIQVIRERDPAIKSNMEVLLYPSFKVILRYRVAHKLYLKKHYFLARWISQRAARKTGIEIHPGATIGKGLFIDHGSGVIIGETTIIGDNVTLYQGVTLGGTGKEQGKRHPTLEDNVMVSAGAKILGSFTIGENSKIGAGSVVLEEVPPNCTVVGVPGRVVRMGNKKVPRSDMDQIHLPDPVLNDIHSLQADNEKMHSQLIEMLKKMKCMEEDGYECGQEKTTKIKIEEKREEI